MSDPSARSDMGVLQRTYPYLALFGMTVFLADLTNPGFTAVVGSAAYVGNAVLKNTLGGEPLYVPR